VTEVHPKPLVRSSPAQKAGIVHLGLGAFFRAHGAVYIKESMAHSGGNWGVVGVSLRSPGVRDLLASQGGLYSAVETSGDGLKPHVVDIITDVLVAPEDPAAVLDAMAAEDTRIVSLTVTEKGYCRGSGPGALDLDHPDIRHDLTDPLPRSAPGYIVRALDIRRQRGLRPFTVLSLDNLPGNGRLTRRIVTELAAQVDPAVADWIERECCFPSTMIDRIVPATTPELVDRLRSEKGIDDPAAVFHEPFRQWVIEDQFVDDERPDLEAVCVQMVDNVEPFEHMKLRMLNGTHSALAYIGGLAGYETVADAMGDQTIAGLLGSMWHDEIIPTLVPPPGVDLRRYAGRLSERYRNPEIRHLLEQIAMDGSQKLPQRILDPLFENLAAGRPYDKLLTVVAAWARFLQSRAKIGRINDPLAEKLASIVQNARGDAQLVASLLAVREVFAGYPVDTIEEEMVERVGAFGANPPDTDIGSDT